MIRLSHHYVETKFIACFLELYKLSNDHIQLHQNGCIGNAVLMQLIEKLYVQFMRTNQDYNNWFDRQVIECSLTSNKSKLKVPIVKISRKPLFIAVFKKKHIKYSDGYYRTYFYPSTDSTFYSDEPIPIQLEVMFEHFNLDGPENLTTSNCPSFVNLYIYQDGKVVNDSTCPGISDTAKIEIAFNKNDFYWVLDQVPKVFKCCQHPGLCSRLFKRKLNRERHEMICKVETEVKSKQVFSL